jgi:hypothetical protein
MSREWGKILLSTRLEKQVTPRFFQAWTELISRGLRPGDGHLAIAGKVAHRAQNDVVRHFLLRTDCDTLLTLDSDADVSPDFVERLRSHDAGLDYDILQAFYPRRGWPPRAIWMKRNSVGDMMECFVTDPDLTEDVDMVGTHACLFRREVFTKLLGDNDPMTFDWFYYARHREASEDGLFSTEAQQAGFRLGATTTVRAGHVTEVTTTWDTYQDFLEISGSARLVERYHELTQLVSDFTGETEEEVIRKAAAGTTIVRDAWNANTPATPGQERTFYGRPDNGYLYDLLAWNCTPMYEQILRPLRGISGQRVLVIGTGLGTEADVMADHNEVTCFELPGTLRDFATKRLGERVKWTDNFSGECDLIVAIDTLEHIHPDEFATFLDDMQSVLAPHGALYAHNTWGLQEAYPQHHDNSAYFNAWCKRVGLVQKGECLWQR